MPRVALPFADAAKILSALEGKPKPMQMASSGGLKPRVLIADDDPVYTLMLFERLIEAGFEIVVATTGTDAITELRKARHPPVAVLAGKLPGMDGSEICERMRDAGKDVFLILSLPDPTTQDIVAGLEVGADLVLPKSIPLEQLLAHIKVGARIINRQRALSKKIEEITGTRPAAPEV